MRLPPERESGKPWLIFLPFLIFGLGCQGVGLFHTVVADYRVLTWQPVRAVVVKSQIRQERVFTPSTVRDGGDGVRQSALATAGISVTYSYEFKNQAYESAQVGQDEFEGGLGGDPSDWVRAHPAGTSLTAYVDPRIPGSAAINVRPVLSWAIEMLTAIPFTIIGLAGVFVKGAPHRLNYEKLALAWGGLTVAPFFIGRALTLGVFIVAAIYFAFVMIVQKWTRGDPPEDIQEDAEAPPPHPSEFRG